VGQLWGQKSGRDYLPESLGDEIEGPCLAPFAPILKQSGGMTEAIEWG
jgi:hypothetical protein